MLHAVAPRLQLHESYFGGDKLWWEPIPLLLPSHPKDKLSFNRYDGFLERKPLINSGTVGRELFFFFSFWQRGSVECGESAGVAAKKKQQKKPPPGHLKLGDAARTAVHMRRSSSGI